MVQQIKNLSSACEWHKWASLSYVLTFDWVSKRENSRVSEKDCFLDILNVCK